MSDVRLKPPASNALSAKNGMDEANLNYSTHPDELGFGDDKWPAWKVTVFVLGVCGAFWTGFAYLLMNLLG